jgi:hypothetical protein
MAKKIIQARNCHECGFEAIDDCENEKIHRSSRETQLLCSVCVRNPEKKTLTTNWRADFFHEQWRLDSKGQPGFDDPELDLRAHELLQTLHLIVMEKEVSA